MVTLSQEDVNSLFNYLNDQPVKFAVPVINFINERIEKQKNEELENEKLHQQFEDQIHSIAPVPKENPVQALSPDNIEVHSPEIVPYENQIVE